jgi:hypothetical protein
VTLPNNTAVQFKDSGGSAQNLLLFNGSNLFKVGDFTGSFQTSIGGSQVNLTNNTSITGTLGVTGLATFSSKIQVGTTAGSYTNSTYFTDLATLGAVINLARPSDGAYTNSFFSYDTAAGAKNNLGITSRNDIQFVTGGIAGPSVIFASTGATFSGTLGVTGAARFYSPATLQCNALGTRKDTSLNFDAANGGVLTYGTIGLQITSASAGSEVGGLTFWTINNSSLTEKMFISGAGNVGIGTTSPYVKLDVSGTTAAPSALSANPITSGTFVLSDATHTVGAVMGTAANGSSYDTYIQARHLTTGNVAYNLLLQPLGGNVGIGTTTPGYKLEISTDSAGKPGVGGLWTVVSDARIKTDIVPADLNRCYEIVKSVPLKHFGFASGVYTDDQIQDKHNLGWIAQDVQKVFRNAVSAKPFTLKTDIPDGTETYEEQEFTVETVEKTETSIQVIDGKPVQVSRVVTSENKVLLFDTVDVLDEAGDVVIEGGKPLTYQMPRMITKTRPKVRHDVIEDCLDLNGGQMIAALYGAVQAIMDKGDALTARVAALEAH